MDRPLKFSVFWASALTIAIDQAIKLLAISKIPQNGFFIFLGRHWQLKLELVSNKFLAFGAKAPELLVILIAAAIIALLAKFCLNAIKANNVKFALAISILVGAAASNLADRIFRRAVIDFISITLNDFTWPSFNFADAVISIGIIYLMIRLFRENRTKIPA